MKASEFTDALNAFIIKQGENGILFWRSAARLGSARRHTSTGRISSRADATRVYRLYREIGLQLRKNES